LCGAVEIEAKTLAASVGAGHSSMSRKWSGGTFFALGGRMIPGEDKVSWYATSDWAERAFCRQCGTHLF
jgi:hypothetical protein